MNGATDTFDGEHGALTQCAEDVAHAPEYTTRPARIVDEEVECPSSDALVELHRERDRPTLLRISAPWCPRCGPFADTVRSLGRQYDVRVLYIELNDEDRDVVEEFSIAQLPAYILCTPTSDPDAADTLTIRQGTDAIEHIRRDVQDVCGLRRVFVLDADF